MLKPCLAALLFAAVFVPAHADVYEWREGDKLHYGDRPPPGVEARLVRGSAPAPAVVNEDATTDEAQKAREKADEMRAARENAAETKAFAAEELKRKEEMAQNCQRARGQLAALESGQRIARFNEQGEREILGDTARQQEAERTSAFINANCDSEA